MAMAVSSPPRPSGLADVLDLILDKGLVIDAYVRVSVIGIEVLTIDARIVVASVDTYLRFAEATNRLDLEAVKNAATLQDLQERGAAKKAEGALKGGKEALSEGKEKLTDKFSRDKDEDEQEQEKQRQEK